jgi:hypothetical protein
MLKQLLTLFNAASICGSDCLLGWNQHVRMKLSDMGVLKLRKRITILRARETGAR